MLTRALIVLLIVLNLGVAAWWALRAGAARCRGTPRRRRAEVVNWRTNISRQHRHGAGTDAGPGTDARADAGDHRARGGIPWRKGRRCSAFRFGPFVDEASAWPRRRYWWRFGAESGDAHDRRGGGDCTVPALPFADMTSAWAGVKALNRHHGIRITTSSRRAAHERRHARPLR